MSHSTPQAYSSDLEYLDDVLSLISLRLQREVLIQRRLRGDNRQESFLGLFLSDDDIDSIFEELNGTKQVDEADSATLDDQVQALREYISARVLASDRPLPPQRLAMAFGLNNNETDLILYLLAPELDDRFGRVYGYLHDDVSRKRLSAGLAYRLMQDSVSNMAVFRAMFSDTSALVFFSLLTTGDGQERKKMPLMDRPLRLQDRVVDFLMGDNRLAPILFGCATLRGSESGNISVLSSRHNTFAARLAKHLQEQSSFLVLEGSVTSDTELWASAIATHLKCALLELDWRVLKQIEKNQRLSLIKQAQREARLQSALLYIHRIDEAKDEDVAELNRSLVGPICLGSTGPHMWRDIGLDAEAVSLPETTLSSRLQLWQQALEDVEKQGLTLDASQPKLGQHLAESYPLSSREMTDVMRGLTASMLVDEADVGVETHLFRACKRMVGRAMDGVAQRIDTPFGFSDLVLPTVTINLLTEIILKQQHSVKVLKEWALAQLFHQVSGCRALFAGPSGTGKTMAATVLANELGLELYRVDLSQVVSKYIGETEKNLDRVFNAADRARVVLFIDEADALFGKRSEVKDAHDRYANIETSFLLQKMEEYDGIAILATNLSQNMDDAFFRRIDLIVDFPMPQGVERLRLWQRLCQSAAPLAADVDFDFLAKNFELSGGHIKNCILSAAYYAAEEDKEITMAHLMRAIGREYMKIGKPISKSAFGDFYISIRKSMTAHS